MLLVAANLLPLLGVVFFGWAVYDVLFLFWLENLVIGVFTIARLLTLYRRRGEQRALVLIPFFCLHYGAFTVGHLVFLMVLFRPDDPAATGAVMGVGLPLIALMISHGASFILNFLRAGEYTRTDGKAVMQAPYSRVVVLHITILAGGAVISALGEPVYALALLVVLKIAIDVVAHMRLHRGTGSGQGASGVFREWD